MMLTALSDKTLFRGLRPDDLIRYLLDTGWKQADDTAQQWQVFVGESDVVGEPLEIVLPADPEAADTDVYLAVAVDTLAAVTEESPQRVIESIRFYDRDVLTIRNMETGQEDSITLDLAAEQISDLKRLVAYAACSERDQRPYFLQMLRTGSEMVKRYRFGHTVRGSFGFTIESPVIRPMIATQEPLMPEYAETLVSLPLERRVMERIVRGLQATEEATAERDVQTLVRRYPRGFNANMCAALVRMSKERLLPIECSVRWSPRLTVSSELHLDAPIRLVRRSYDLLDEAASELAKLAPEIVVVRGMIVELAARDDPHSLGTRRSVAIQWTDRPEGERPLTVSVALDRDDYLSAIEAHRNWSTVEVTGSLEREGVSWRLSEPQGFRVIR